MNILLDLICNCISVQVHLDQEMKQMSDFLATEERRAGVYLTEPPEDGYDETPALTEKDVWSNIQDCLKRSKKQLDRCKGVIKKLHQDCEVVARQNADIVEHTKECDAKIKAVLSVGRHSAKQKTVPRKTQDIFNNLMDDIEKLVKTRKRVLDKETEGRRHSTRIIRQCRDWIESRTLALKKLNSGQAHGASKNSDQISEDGTIGNTHRDAPPVNDNAIMSILDSIQLMERELQEYVHQELTATDNLRTELRRKQLQKKLHGFSVHGMADIENALDNLEKHPESLKENVQVVKTCIREINKEYGDCVSYLDRVDPDSVNGVQNTSPSTTARDQRPRNWPATFKKKQYPGGSTNRHTENGPSKVEPNQLLDRLKALAVKHEELKNEEQNLSNKFRTELSKKKRDMDLILQKKEDHILRLQTDIKEITAEKEKYKKLYNDTKIGYQRNHDSGATPR